MSALFTNILIPVDFSEKTDVALQKAIELANPVNSVIHLFHIANASVYFRGCVLYGYSFYTPVLNDWYNGEVEMKMQSYKDKIRQSLSLTEVVTHMVSGGSVQDNIITTANNLKVNLIIFCKRKSHKWLPFLNTINSSLVARKTNSAVLMIRPGVGDNRIRSIVLPVRSFIPERKIELLSLLTRKHKPVVHLVTNNKKDQPIGQTGALVDTFRTLTHYLNYPVIYTLLKDKNFARGILNYAENITADLILVNPEETKVNSIYKTDMNDLIAPSSKLTVLTAEPFHQ